MSLLLLVLAFLAASEASETNLDLGSVCTSCEYIVSKLPEEILHSSLPEAVSSLCAKTPIEGCAEKMQQFYAPLLKSLSGQKSNSLVCREIGWCQPQQLDVAKFQQTKMTAQQSEQTKRDISCGVCVKGFTAFRNLVDPEGTGNVDPYVFLETFCSQVPDQMKELCFRSNATKLLSYAAEDAQTACKRSHMCTEDNFKRASSLKLSVPPNLTGARCQACQWAVSAIEAYFAQDTTTDELSRILQELCTVLPGDYAEVCQNFVLVYTPQALGWTIDNLTPPVVCEQINFCGDDDK
eukprot:TRINITY_DN13105_c0_g1_i1.p1 TRINITY_DN13105_c0_g1~~TRINITY_DN13105_c0_g1_i1.p1  ORF type:complete len:294 (-),score=57.93 TRINITY_DN13105_c0_g1_i1:28-909(-)